MLTTGRRDSPFFEDGEIVTFAGAPRTTSLWTGTTVAKTFPRMRLPSLYFLMILGLAAAPLIASDRPVVTSSEAAGLVGKAATVYGKVIEVRRVANGPIIFELDGKPTAPTFRALVYPMSAPRFGASPENVYLGQTVEVTGIIVIRKDLPQMWLSDPTQIRLHPDAAKAPTATPGHP
jgi:hypothetical protein